MTLVPFMARSNMAKLKDSWRGVSQTARSDRGLAPEARSFDPNLTHVQLAWNGTGSLADPREMSHLVYAQTDIRSFVPHGDVFLQQQAPEKE
ncbi:hypothetical protein ED733_007167 [Metarhizium rileyi]|uniref:Uncharacterized protein n=1 Tax=Metarhizium rileyi (strain RCEF 4871) TaxID=1649241 RepID=A0A5C6GP62_METRR|nr:hypothetical protein ED733_007167 [Metarhizium rileyi]